MPVLYIDTSAVVKRYHLEHGSQVVDELFENPVPDEQFHTSFLTLLEVISGIERLADSGELDRVVVQPTLARFRSDLRDRFHLWPISNDTIAQAASIVGPYKLRSADAIHLATALSLSLAVSASRTVMVSSDRKLIRSAGAAGLLVLDPTDAGALGELRQLRSRT